MKVIEKVQKNVACVHQHRLVSQIPEFNTRLSREVYFPPYKENVPQLKQSVAELLRNYV